MNYEEIDEEPKWYVLHTFSGYENVAKENLEVVRDKFNWQDRILEIMIPMEEVVEDKDGKKKLVSRKVMPTYLLVKMKYGNDMWHHITKTRGITGFVGPKGRPLPLTDDEIRKMRLEKIYAKIELAIGDKVEVIDGPLDGMIGTVVNLDPDMNRIKANVEMFGRETPVELDYSSVRRIDA